MFCDSAVREMGVSMVIAAWGEGVNVCLCPPSPSSFAQNARKNADWGLDSSGKYVLCCSSARDGRFDGDCSLGGGG
jgi:hypothetical protein